MNYSLAPFPWKVITTFLMQRRTHLVVKSIASFLKKRERVLDVGAGAGWIAQKVQEKSGADVTLLDIIDFNQTNLPLQLYNGKQIPFKDNAFDATLLVFMLHHCSNPLEVLREAVRVSKSRIIIMEDTFTNKLDRFFACANDWSANLPTFVLSGFKDQMNIPFHFKKVEEWQRAFERLGLSVVHVKTTRSFPIPVQKTLFVLEKQ